MTQYAITLVHVIEADSDQAARDEADRVSFELLSNDRLMYDEVVLTIHNLDNGNSPVDIYGEHWHDRRPDNGFDAIIGAVLAKHIVY